MSEFGLKHMTRDHYTGFGMIVHVASEIDGLMDRIIVAMAHVTYPTFFPILTFLTAKDKRDYITAMAKASTLPPAGAQGLIDLMERTKKAFAVRNDVAHCVWAKGRRAGAIKPLMLSARGVLKTLGSDHNEREWTAPQLIAEAHKIHELGVELATLMTTYGLNPALPGIPTPPSRESHHRKMDKPRQGG